jgi:hypothetical protein
MNRRAVALLSGLVILSALACNVLTPAPADLPTGPPETPPREDQPAPTLPPSPGPGGTQEQAPTPEPPPQVPTAKPPPEAPPAPTSLNVPLRIDNPLKVARTGEPVTSGVPLPRDLGLTDPDRLRLVDAAGTPVPAQFTPLARWGGSAGLTTGGSAGLTTGGPPDDDRAPIRWVLIDFQATVGPQDTADYFLQEGGPGPVPAHSLVVTDSADALTIDTGVAEWRISKADGDLDGPGLGGPIFSQALSATTYEAAGPVTVRVALEGPMRVSVHVRGAYRDFMGTPLLEYTSRYWFTAGQPSVHLFHTVENNTLCPLAEYGQLDCYDVGSGGSIEIGDLSFIVPTDLGGDLTYWTGGEGEPVSGPLRENLLLYQNSSGTDHWDTYATLTNWEGNPLDTRPRMQSAVTFRGYRTTLGAVPADPDAPVIDSGDQAAGWLSVTGENGSWTVGVRDFWQNFPKALRARYVGVLEVGLFPDEFGPPEYAFTLRAGEHKTHEILLSPLPHAQAAPLLHPLFAQAPAQWYVESGAFGLMALPDQMDWPDHESYVNHQLDTAPAYEDWMDWYPNLPIAIESTDFYGIFDYGDWPIDYEGYGVAPLNAKYDNDYGMWLQWARTGDPRWFHLAEAADRHVADVDILHNLHTPRHWGDGIAFGHSYHDEDGFLNPHRNYGGNHPDTAFGMKGMLLAYYLTGYEKAHKAALELADCIEYRLHNDYNLCEYFPDCSGEGFGLGEGMYDAGCRPAANSLSIAVAAYRATADPRYLAVADAVVDWARAEKQPYIDGPTGADQMMRPWMLNMYLRALADYLEMRDEFGLPDAYDAKGAFLSYAHWLRTYAWLDLEPIDTGPRAAYPYEWWFDGRQGDPSDEWATGNNIPSISNWLLLGADAMATAYRLSGDADYLERGAALFRTGSRDPWFEGDANTYSSTKETANGITFGHIFLHEWARGQ